MKELSKNSVTSISLKHIIPVTLQTGDVWYKNYKYI